jgi:Flp pilus assembly protein TadD
VALGNALYVAGQVDPAALQFAAAIRLDPQDADAHNDLGICWAARRQFDRAAAEFETAAELRPGFAAAELNWSRSLQELGQPEAAALHRRRAAQLQAAGGR